MHTHIAVVTKCITSTQDQDNSWGEFFFLQGSIIWETTYASVDSSANMYMHIYAALSGLGLLWKVKQQQQKHIRFGRESGEKEQGRISGGWDGMEGESD